MSTETCPHALAAIEINVFDANGVRSTQLFTNGDADFRMSGREFTIDVKRAVTPAMVERAERAAVSAYAQAGRAEQQANIARAQAETVTVNFDEAALRKIVGEIVKPARKATRRKR